jgi:torus domain-containing protein
MLTLTSVASLKRKNKATLTSQPNVTHTSTHTLSVLTVTMAFVGFSYTPSTSVVMYRHPYTVSDSPAASTETVLPEIKTAAAADMISKSKKVELFYANHIDPLNPSIKGNRSILEKQERKAHNEEKAIKRAEKTKNAKVCSFFTWGRCRYSDDCPFKHDLKKRQEYLARDEFEF